MEPATTAESRRRRTLVPFRQSLLRQGIRKLRSCPRDTRHRRAARKPLPKKKPPPYRYAGE